MKLIGQIFSSIQKTFLKGLRRSIEGQIGRDVQAQ